MNKAEINKLVVRAQNGDRSAFEELYNEFRDRVFFFAKRTTGSADAAEDITSETFVKALESIGTLREGESFVGWLYTIAYNLCMAQLRDNSHIERFGSDEAQTDAVESAALREPVMLPEEYAVSAETKRKLGEIIDSLSPDMRSAVILYYYEEQTIPEVAKALGTNEHNASQKLYKAKKRIRKGLEKVFGKGALLAAVPMEAMLRTTEEAGYVKAAAVGAKVAGLGIGAKIVAVGAAAVIAVGVPIGLYKLGESKGDYRPNEIKELSETEINTSETEITSNSSANNDERRKAIDKLQPNFISFNQKYEYLKTRYKSKEILIWLTQFTPQHEIEINDYLYENNYDYVVCFKNISDFSEGDKYSALKKQIDNNEQIDILSVFSVKFGEEYYSNRYYYMIENGYLESLDSYLSKEEYSKYVNTLPQKYWDSYKYKGHIYGVDNTFSTLCEDYGYIIDKSSIDSCGMQPSDFCKSPNELEELLLQVKAKTNKIMNFNISFFINSFIQKNHINDSIAIIDKKAQNVFDTTIAIQYYQMVDNLRKKGLATVDSSFPQTNLMETYLKSGGYGNDITSNDNNNITVFYKQNNYIKNPVYAYGISCSSKHKTQSFNFLMNLIFNKDLNNIATYGTEGLFYHLDENKNVIMEQNVNNPESTYIPDIWYSNPYICFQCYDPYSPIYVNDIYSDYENAEFTDGFGFYYDGSAYKDIYNNLAQAQHNFKASQENIEQYLDEFNELLKSVGIDILIDDINIELEKYYAKKN